MVTNSDQPPETGLAPAPVLQPREEGLAPGVSGCQSGLSSTLVLITWGTACHLASSPRQSPLIHLKLPAAFAEWDFKQ